VCCFFWRGERRRREEEEEEEERGDEGEVFFFFLFFFFFFFFFFFLLSRRDATSPLFKRRLRSFLSFHSKKPCFFFSPRQRLEPAFFHSIKCRGREKLSNPERTW